MRSRLFSMLVALFAVTSLSVLPACDIPEDAFKDDGNGDPYSDDTPWDGGGGSDTGGMGTQSTQLTFSISESVSLQAQTDIVKKADLAKTRFSPKTGKELFTYEVIKGGQNFKTITFADGTKRLAVDSAEDAGTNLLAVDADGNADLAFTADFPIKVMYTVLDPSGDYVYLALDNGWNCWEDNSCDNNDYTQFISATNCALFRVNTSDDTYECAAEGLIVQTMNQVYTQTISGNQKPIQFDADGNLYLTATSFSRTCDSATWMQWVWDDSPEGGHEEEITDEWCWFDMSSWKGQIFKIAAPTTDADGVDTWAALETITQDTEQVDFFLTLSSGEIVFQSFNDTTWTADLKMFQEGTGIIDITDGTWGVPFFTGDDSNAILYGTNDWNATAGIQFAKPAEGGGFFKASLNTKLFGYDPNSGYSPKPERIIVGDDGNLYAIFTQWYWEEVETAAECSGTFTDNSDYNWGNSCSGSRLKVFQTLPYDPIEKVSMELGDDWWSWMWQTPFQISQGYLYYKDNEDVYSDAGASLGTRDFIRWVRLSDRKKGTILNHSSSERYEIYSWKLSGNNLYFSGLDKVDNVVVSGEINVLAMKMAIATNPDVVIDTTLVADVYDVTTGNMVSRQVYTLTEFASASNATSAIQDIEVLQPAPPALDPGGTLSTTWYTDKSNIYSASVEFSKRMVKSSVENNLTVTDGAATDIAAFPIWIQNKLHLFPDLSINPNTTINPDQIYISTYALSDSTTEPLAAGTTYTFALAATGVVDIYGGELAGETHALTTKPDNGWGTDVLNGDAPDSTVASGDVGEYYGAEKTNSWDWVRESFFLPYSIAGGDFRLEFSGNGGPPNVTIWDMDCWDNGASAGSAAVWNSDTSEYDGYCWYTGREWESSYASLDINSWAYLNIQRSDWEWVPSEDTPELFNGDWKRYRWDFYGVNSTFSYCEATCGSAANWTVVESLTRTDAHLRAGTDYRVAFRLTDLISLDDIEITSLDVDGVLSSTAGDLMIIDFEGTAAVGTSSDGEIGAPVADNEQGFDDDVQDTYWTW